MSTKKCIKCGEEFEGERDICMECDAKNVEENEHQGMKEGIVDETPIEETLETGDSKETDVNVSKIEPAKIEDTEKVGHSNKKNNKKIIGIISAVAIIIISIFGVKMYTDYKDEQAHQAYVKDYNEYLSNVEAVKMDMLSGAATTETITNGLVSVWNNAIWKKDNAVTDKFTKVNGVFVDDFNTAISAFQNDTDNFNDIMDLTLNQSSVKDTMKLLNKVPEGLENHHERVSDLYEIYAEFTNLAISPTGSLKSFTESVSSLDSEFITKYNNMDLLDYTKIK